MIVFVPVKDKRVWARLEQNVQAALNFTPGSEGGRQKLQEKVAPSRAAWHNSLRTRQDTVARYWRNVAGKSSGKWAADSVRPNLA